MRPIASTAFCLTCLSVLSRSRRILSLNCPETWRKLLVTYPRRYGAGKRCRTRIPAGSHSIKGTAAYGR